MSNCQSSVRYARPPAFSALLRAHIVYSWNGRLLVEWAVFALSLLVRIYLTDMCDMNMYVCVYIYIHANADDYCFLPRILKFIEKWYLIIFIAFSDSFISNIFYYYCYEVLLLHFPIITCHHTFVNSCYCFKYLQICLMP